MQQIYFFGDSIAYGAWDDEGGWVARLRKRIDAETLLLKDNWALFYNLSISGETAAGVLERFEREMDARPADPLEDEITIVFAIGTNDSIVHENGEYLHGSIKDYAERLVRLSQLAKKYSANIIFVGLFNIDQVLVDPIPWVPEQSYKNVAIKAFNETIEAVCAQANCRYVSLVDLWNEQGAGAYLFDGVHPNSQGHALIAERVFFCLPQFYIPLEVISELDRVTSAAKIIPSGTIDQAVVIFETEIGRVDLFKFRRHAVSLDHSWSYQIGQGLYEIQGDSIVCEVPIKTGYKYDLTCPYLVNLSPVANYHSWKCLVSAVKSGTIVDLKYKNNS